MRTAPTALKNWIAAGNNIAARADLVTLTLSGGTVYRWTTFDRPLTVGGNTFMAYPNAPLIQRGAISQTSRLTVDYLDVSLFGVQINSTNLGALAASGFFDGARFQLDHLLMPTPGDVSLGAIPSYFEGRVSTAEPRGPSVDLRIKSELEALNEQVPRFQIGPSCGNAVYDANCGLSKAAFTLTGTVSSATTSTITTASAALTAKASGYFNLGMLKFTSGALAGASRTVTGWTGSVFTLAYALPAAPSAGDAFSVYPGCDRTRSSCALKFLNLPQYRGFPHAPSNTAGGSR